MRRLKKAQVIRAVAFARLVSEDRVCDVGRCRRGVALAHKGGNLGAKQGSSIASVCLIASGDCVPNLSNQSVQDFEVLRDAGVQEALRRSSAPYFLWVCSGDPLHPQALEECIWGLMNSDWVAWSDSPEELQSCLDPCIGPLAVRRATLEKRVRIRSDRVWRLPWSCHRQSASPAPRRAPITRNGFGLTDRGAAGPLERILNHPENAELLCWRSWGRHPLRSLLRLVPLRVKEAINRRAATPVFDLGFYRRFQGYADPVDRESLRRVKYRTPRKGSRHRVALCTLHLGHGGAEIVFLELARQFDRRHFELFLIVTRPQHDGLASHWYAAVDHVYDLGHMADPKHVRDAIYSLAANWRWDGFVLQNNLDAYSVVPALKQELPNLCVIDVLHNIHEGWDYFSATAAVGKSIDRRVTISQAGSRRLANLGCRRETIQVIRNGVDLERFQRHGFERGGLHRSLNLPADTQLILFAGALVDRKRPVLLVDIDRELHRLGTSTAYCFVVAGDGPEAAALDAAIRSEACASRFRVLGHVDSIAPLLADSAVLVLPSTEEGVPLVIIEALSMGVPVVSSRVGAIEEAVTPACGVLLDNDGREPQAFAYALSELLRDPGRREKLGAEGRRFVERNYDLTRARAEYQDLLEEMFPR